MARPRKQPWLALWQSPGSKRKFWFIHYMQHGGTRRKSTGCLPHEAEQAQAVFAEWLQSRPVELPNGPRRASASKVADIVTRYTEQHGPLHASPETTIHRATNLIRYWHNMTVDQIRTETCQAYMRERTGQLNWQFPDRKDFRSTVRGELAVLRAAINWNVMEGYLTESRPVWLPDPPAARQRWLTRQEAAALLRAARGVKRVKRHLPIFILIGIYTGQRSGAILSLQWQPNMQGGHVDLKNGIIDFNALGRRQTKKKRPIIKIGRRLMRFLEHARKHSRQYVVEYDGKPIKSLKHSFNTACKTAGVEDVTPHTMRHTAVTWRMQGGMKAREIADYVGMTEDMVERVYGHQHPDFQSAAADAY